MQPLKPVFEQLKISLNFITFGRKVNIMDRFWYSYIGASILLGILAIAMRDNIIFLSIFILAQISLITLLIFAFIKSTTSVRETLSEIVDGQLNINIKKSRIKIIDLIGKKINEYLAKIRNLVCQYQNFSEKTIKESSSIKNQAESLKITSSEIASTVQNIAEAVNSQAESTAKVRENVETFSRGVVDIYENANISVGVAKDSKVIVEKSFETFDETFKKIEEIKDYNDKVLGDMSHLDEAIRQISTITEAVEAIASQTQLLALNASIEAARAGEAGRGFAVVAEEISKLADNSSESAKKIKELVENIIGKINGLTINIKGQTGIISNNITYAKKALDKSEDINKAVDKNMEAADTIVRLTGRQKEKIEDITHAIEVIDETTQQNAAVSEEITASTQEQLSIIETMYDSVIYLNNAIEYSNGIISKFVEGFKITDEIKEKVEKTKKLVEEISTSQEIFTLQGERLHQYIVKKQNSVDFIELISLVTKDGYQKITTEDVPEEHRDVSARPYFLEAISGKLSVSEVYISTFSNHYNITIAAPIFKDNKTVGVVLTDINLNEN